MQQPAFWYRPLMTWQAWLLWPLALLYRLAVAVNMVLRRRKRRDAGVPLVSIGNLTVGGSGKTPLTLVVAEHLQRKGYAVAVVSCGSGGTRRVPVRVTAACTAAEVGDEAKLMALRLPEVAVWSGPSKPQTVRAAVAAGATLVVLDDGFQRVDVARTVDILVVGMGGLGNGCMMPAGPLREPVSAAARADMVVAMGGMPPLGGSAPVLTVSRRLDAAVVAGLQDTPVVAFAAIARPERFFGGLREAGVEVVAERAFADHKGFSPTDLAALREEAARAGAVLVCTEKDMVKLPEDFPAVAVPLVVDEDEVAPVLEMIEERL